MHFIISICRRRRQLFAWNSPGLWAIVSIAAIGMFNLMGPKHTGAFAIAAAVGMVFITLLITVRRFAAGQLARVASDIGRRNAATAAGKLWIAFVSIVLALSGVEAIANLTGVMKKPVPVDSRQGDLGRRARSGDLQRPAGDLHGRDAIAAPTATREHTRTTCSRSSAAHYVGLWAELGRSSRLAACCCSRPPIPPSPT